MLTMGLEILVVIIISIRMVISVLWSKVMHLLWTRTKLVWATISASHRHYKNVSGSSENSIGCLRLTLPWRLLRVHLCWISILRTWTHARIHTIHWWLRLVALLRSLAHHHWSSSARAWISIDARHWWWRVTVLLWYKMSLIWRIHHVWPLRHTLGGHEAICRILHHDWWHLLLLRHELMVLRERPERLHRRAIRILHHLGVVGQLCRLIHGRRESHGNTVKSGRCKRLRRLRRHHAMVIGAIERWGWTMAVLVTVDIYVRLSR